MYPDTKRVRHHRIAINLNDYEHDAKSLLLDAQNNQRKDANEVTNQEL